MSFKCSPINPRDISVVVQGPISGLSKKGFSDNQFTKRCLESIRQYLPGSEIILSTWVDSNVDGLVYDKLILSQDPGGEPLFWDKTSNTLNNINRQIISTKAGVKKVKRQYILKIRSDIALMNANFLDYFNKYKNYERKITKARVLTCSFFARNPRIHRTPMPFHPSDWVFFGYTEDILDIWDIPIISKEELNFFSKKTPCPFMLFKNLKSRFFPEQFIWISFLSKHTKVSCEHAFDNSNDNILLSEKSIANNLVILSLKQFGIKFLKNKLFFNYSVNSIYSHNDWKKLYNKYCLANESVCWFDRQKFFLFLRSQLIENPRKYLLILLAFLRCVSYKYFRCYINLNNK